LKEDKKAIPKILPTENTAEWRAARSNGGTKMKERAGIPPQIREETCRGNEAFKCNNPQERTTKKRNPFQTAYRNGRRVVSVCIWGWGICVKKLNKDKNK